MKVSKWVDVGQEVEIEIGVDDIRVALAEAFSTVTQDRLGEDGPNRAEVAFALNSIAQFLKALTSTHISLLSPTARKLTATFLAEQSRRFEVTEVSNG